MQMLPHGVHTLSTPGKLTIADNDGAVFELRLGASTVIRINRQGDRATPRGWTQIWRTENAARLMSLEVGADGVRRWVESGPAEPRPRPTVPERPPDEVAVDDPEARLTVTWHPAAAKPARPE